MSYLWCENVRYMCSGNCDNFRITQVWKLYHTGFLRVNQTILNGQITIRLKIQIPDLDVRIAVVTIFCSRTTHFLNFWCISHRNMCFLRWVWHKLNTTRCIPHHPRSQPSCGSDHPPAFRWSFPQSGWYLGWYEIHRVVFYMYRTDLQHQLSFILVFCSTCIKLQ